MSFRYKDYHQRGRKRTMTLEVEAFLRRLSLHVLPKGFTKIRHYGILSNRNRKEKVDRCQELLDGSREDEFKEDRDEKARPTTGEGRMGLPPCPHCGKPGLEVIDTLRGPVKLWDSRGPPGPVQRELPHE